MSLSDGELLMRFLRQRDAAAFEALITRHGPMVLGVCRRLLRCEHDAADAFQAVFLLLARKARSIRKRHSVGSWLYGVAYRVSVRLRQQNELRRLKESHMAEVHDALPKGDPLALVAWRELRPVLDEELSRLPEKYRAPLVLCYLEGKTNEQAATELGWPAGSMAKRLAYGRELLRERLSRRGVTLSATLLFGAMTAHASAAVPSSLAAGAGQAALSLVAGQTAAVSGQVLTLVEGMARTMQATYWKTAAAIVLALGVLAAGIGVSYHVLAAETRAAVALFDDKPQEKAPEKKKPKKDADKPKDEFDLKVRKAIETGVAHLKSSQRGGDWEHAGFGGRYQGGLTALAVLALLEAGGKVDDHAVAKGLQFLRTVEPRDTYVVGLQTAALAKANERRVAAIIKNLQEETAAYCRDLEDAKRKGTPKVSEHELRMAQARRDQYAAFGSTSANIRDVWAFSADPQAKKVAKARYDEVAARLRDIEANPFAVSVEEQRMVRFQRDVLALEAEHDEVGVLTLYVREFDARLADIESAAKKHPGPSLEKERQLVLLQRNRHALLLEGANDLVLIKLNAAWLRQGAKYENNQLIGWGYQMHPGGLPGADNSNTQYAVLGLHAAAQAGANVDAKLWDDLRDYYLRTQKPDGGWAYRNEGGRSTITMTAAGIIGLGITRQYIDQKNRDFKNVATNKAIEKALEHLAKVFTVDNRQWRYYSLYGLARAGQTVQRKQFDQHEWYREGAEFLLNQQATNGGWSSQISQLDGNPVISTSFAILFLVRKP